MKWVRWIVLLGVGAAMLAGLVVLSGLVPVTASSGHFPITAWGLELAMERSVATNSLGIEPPPLANEALVMQGAAHFESGCAWCHGQPQSAPGRIVTHMTPHPSDLNEELEKWSDSQLFYIVRHGVKFTGMPAWPAQQRSDEVWSIVAFLKRYNDLTIDQYHELAGINETNKARQQLRRGADIPEVVVQRCVACHGIDGQGRTAFPSLAGQRPTYLMEALASYRSGQRPSGTMGPIADHLSDAQITDIADYFARQSPKEPSLNSDAGQQQAALDLVQRGDAHKRAGACQACHPIDRKALSPAVSPAEHYPLLNGQRVDYLVGQLHLFRAHRRGGGARHHIMHNMVEELDDEQIRMLARFYASR